ncbi:MAG: hypothetical protein LUI13_01420 [Lachnospiraceae bacterium]|nr:hypothetical protein [Lachnospiraceae bacterium]
MKRICEKLVSFVIALVVTLNILPASASAAALDIPSTVTITKYSAKDKSDITGTSFNKQWFTTINGKITNLKSSDESIVKPSKSVTTGGGSTITQLYLIAKKAGEANVSFKYKGTTYTTTVTVKKYTNPISSFKIGSVSVSASKFKTRASVTLKYSKFSGKKSKIKVVLKDGWTIGEEPYENYLYYGRAGWLKFEFLKNGKKVTIKGGPGFAIEIPVINDTTGQKESVVITLK